jgi:hypothetical protein
MSGDPLSPQQLDGRRLASQSKHRFMRERAGLPATSSRRDHGWRGMWNCER